MAALEQGIKELSQNRGAGQILRLIAPAAPPGARIGIAALLSPP